ncbi:MAG: acetylglutamate kinase, partial [Trichodesmium sp. St2_bin6]|nr:acetylglutamate kinase [Trichodesmium sp. St2_bin6]
MLKSTDLKNESEMSRVKVLSEALPYIQKFTGRKIVVKYGGAAMRD